MSMSPNFDFALYFQLQKAMDIRDSDPDLALNIVEQGLKDAIDRNNDEWRLIFEHWRLQIYIHSKRDLKIANRLAIASAIESRKPQYRDYREYICLQNDLILVYDGIDPIGYADEIKEAIDITIDMTTPDISCHFCQHAALLDYYEVMEQDQAARDQAAKYFAMTYNQPHYRINAYQHLCYFSMEDEAWEDLLIMAEQGKDLASDGEHDSNWIVLKAYEMLALHQLGKVEAAEKAYDLVKYRVSTLKMVQGTRYYTVIRKYHELRGDLQTALEIQDEYIATLIDSGRYYWECLARIDRIRLLKLLEKDYQNELDTLRTSAKNLKSEAQMLERLDKIFD